MGLHAHPRCSQEFGHRVSRSTIAPLGERHHRQAVAAFVAHDHRERNHQELDNEQIDGERVKGCLGRVRRHQRLGGLLNYYARAA